MLSPRVVQLVLHTRDSVEELARNYPPGKYWGTDLAGYCGIASRFLIALAKRNSIYGMHLVCGMFNDGNRDATHCWVEGGGHCIDLTISQFNGFKNNRYKICPIDSSFYGKHYRPEMIGTSAVRYQKMWEDGQNYESCSSLLWRIHKLRYKREYNGMVLR